ncbi:MAG: undecaprenyl/decaprenyl-phosphate alpha-N-acetylglucosaminyl 1-phosphate transferase [Treponema sp.]|nr:undecaprenyl/decaprenyl-phosphate alpha-N-acetylglucosaminyl 1-phosphate transferase [Treponema sp.]
MEYIAVGVSLLLSLGLVPIIIAICKKFSLYDEVDPRKIHKGQIPRLGGIAVFLSFSITSLLYSRLFMPGEMIKVWPLLVGGGIIIIAGVIDDLLNLPAKLKFVIQAIAALVVALSPFNYSYLFGWHMPVALSKILTFLWILILVNAYNLIDGMDWICSGLSLLSLLTMSIILRMEGVSYAIIGFILCAAILGFMFWNRPPAKIFLGDGGSQTLGYAIAVLPIISNTNPDVNYGKVIGVVLLASIPTTDVLAAVWRRLRDHRKIFSADRAHIHHKLLNVGFSKNTAIFFILLLQFFVSFSVLLAYVADRNIGVVIMLLMYVVIEAVFIAFHYLNHNVNLRNEGRLESNPQEEH